MRICSLLPSATEILFALGLGDCVVAVTQECDFPPEARSKRRVVTSRIPHTLSAAEIDGQVRRSAARGESIYAVDAEALGELDPELIVTQDLCQVCAASPEDLAAALARLPRAPQILSLHPHSLEDIWEDIRRVGQSTGRVAEAETLIGKLTSRVREISAAVKQVLCSKPRVRVACLEWLDPLFNAGHWVPEMVDLAGGVDVLGQPGKPSITISWQELIAAEPEAIVVMPCGYHADRAAAEFGQLELPAAFEDLPAARRAKVFATDAHSYFSRPGPRVAAGIAVLATIFHPALRNSKVSRQVPVNSFEPIVRRARAARVAS